MSLEEIAARCTLADVQRQIVAQEAKSVVDLALYRNLLRVRAIKQKPTQPIVDHR